MGPIKFNTGDTLQSVMYYIMAENEYGKPTKDSIDSFIESFGNVLINGNFPSNENNRNKVDSWWKEIENELKSRQLHSIVKYTGGFNWFKQLSIEINQLDSNTKDILRNDKDKLKDFILSVKVNEGIDTSIDCLIQHANKTKHNEIKPIALRRRYLTLVFRDVNNEITDELILDTVEDTVVVNKSSINKFVGLKLDSFEQYIMSICIDKYVTKSIISIYDDELSNVKQGKMWEVQMGKLYKPLNIIFNWEEN